MPARNAIQIQDTIKIKSDTTSKDSLDILISPDAPDADVTYSSEDSSYLDAQQKMFYLFGDAVVKYQSYELKAARIRLDMDNDIAYAEGIPDSAGKIIGLPHFLMVSRSLMQKKCGTISVPAKASLTKR